LRDASINHSGANTPLGGVVRRRNGWIEPAYRQAGRMKCDTFASGYRFKA